MEQGGGVKEEGGHLSKEEKKAYRKISVKEISTVILPYVSEETDIGIDKLQHWILTAEGRKLMIYVDRDGDYVKSPRCYQASMFKKDNRVFLTRKTCAGVCY